MFYFMMDCHSIYMKYLKIRFQNVKKRKKQKYLDDSDISKQKLQMYNESISKLNIMFYKWKNREINYIINNKHYTIYEYYNEFVKKRRTFKYK